VSVIASHSVARAIAAIGYHAYPTTPPYNFTKDPESLKQVARHAAAGSFFHGWLDAGFQLR
jgi:hypothetical protein